MPESAHRFLVLTELFQPSKGGTAVWFDDVYRRLGGKETHIVTASVPGDREYDADHPNTIHRLKLRHLKWIRPESLGIYLKFFFQALAVGLRHDIDAVHAGRVLPEGLVAWAVARIIRRPVMIYAHGEEITVWRRNPRRYRAMRFAFRHADVVVANSEFTRDLLLGLDLPPEQVMVVNPGVDVEEFHPDHDSQDLRDRLGMREGQRLILSVGRLNRRKGFDQVIASLPHLIERGHDVRYAIIGIGSNHDYLLSIAKEQGVLDRVDLLGRVGANDLPRWYCAADVFAMPNREINGDTEGFGMVFLEAVACGTPVVAGTAGGTGSAVIDGVTGLRVDGTDVGAVTDALSRLLGDPELAQRLAQHGRERVLHEFSWDAVAARTEAIALAQPWSRNR